MNFLISFISKFFASCSYKFIFCSFVKELDDIDSLFRLLFLSEFPGLFSSIIIF